MPTNSPLITIDDILAVIHANLPNLVHNTEYTLAQLVGHEPWLATYKGHRTQLGSIFKQLAISGDLPVTWVRSGSNNSQIYALK